MPKGFYVRTSKHGRAISLGKIEYFKDVKNRKFQSSVAKKGRVGRWMTRVWAERRRSGYINKRGWRLSKATIRKRNLTIKMKYKNGYVNPRIGCHWKMSKSGVKNVSLAIIEKWKDPKYVSACIKGRHKSPNKKEKLLNSILQKNFLNEWRYVGSGDFILGRKNPDFMNVNGKKLLIELFGGLNWWHTNDEVQPRIDHFKQFGFNTLVIWDHELKDESTVLRKIENFMLNPLYPQEGQGQKTRIREG